MSICKEAMKIKSLFPEYPYYYRECSHEDFAISRQE